jgi:hypothetical protein
MKYPYFLIGLLPALVWTGIVLYQIDQIYPKPYWLSTFLIVFGIIAYIIAAIVGIATIRHFNNNPPFQISE